MSAFPLRAEIFSTNQMEEYARGLASRHKIINKRVPDRLRARLVENEKVLRASCLSITKTSEVPQQNRPVAEWLMDNFYLIEDRIHAVKKSLSREYSRHLPRLVYDDGSGLPRIYEIALEIVSHVDAKIEYESLSRFIGAYQSASPLCLGELWALPLMLELALIENLRRISDRLTNSRIRRNNASQWAQRMIDASEKNPSEMILVIADMVRKYPEMELDSAFIAELVRCLQGQGSSFTLPLQWIEEQLVQSYSSIDQIIQAEIQTQAADQVSVSNSISGLRMINSTNWRDFVEALSLTEKILRLDPAGIYPRMDFATRDRYRHGIEEISRTSTLPEEDVAGKALALARQASRPDQKAGHIGYYLVDRGVSLLEAETRTHLSPFRKARRQAAKYPLPLYLGCIMLLTVFFTAILAAYASHAGAPGIPLICSAFLALIGMSQAAIELTNWLSTLITRPRAISSMDFSGGITDDARTLVAVPALLTSPDNIDHICEALEVRYLANRGPNIYFCLLTDFPDAETQTLPADASLIDYAGNNIKELNAKYAKNDDIFFLLHRPRRWNPQEKIWMSHERKRGKIAALNAFLQTGDASAFSFTSGKIKALKKIEYVITLDADTQLPRDAARELAGAMAHPLNRPHYDEKTGRVTEGYGIIQPRVVASLPGSNVSLYARFFGGEAGVDPYTHAVSDVYQDVFGEGSFVGKGIYDLNIFEQALKGRLPENRILSHDLLEGCYMRAGFLNHAQLYEDYPSGYKADICRRHRWIRGDWQIAGWLLPRVPDPEDSRPQNPLSGLSRWKIFDNLRRSLVPLSLLLLLLIGWIALPFPWLWTIAVAGTFFIPPLCAEIFSLIRKAGEIYIQQHTMPWRITTGRHFFQAAFRIAVLPYEACSQTDAVIRALWRLLVSRRRLLEWMPSSETNRHVDKNIFTAYRDMWISPVLAIVVLLFLLSARPEALPGTIIFLVLWIFSPAVVWWLGRPLHHKRPQLSSDQGRFLNMLARRNWAFFETHVGPADNWLPPDNIQEHPVAVVAHRTSPTNMGLALLANLSAWDFGYITAGHLIERTSLTLEAMKKLPRYRGHFYNWYSTDALMPLNPLYVSSVDSGNLAGHLIALRQGLLAVPSEQIIPKRLFDGLRTTFMLLEDSVDNPEPLRALKDKLDHFPAQELIAAADYLKDLAELAENCPALPQGGESSFWQAAFIRQCQDALKELTSLAPWSALNIPRDWLEKNGLNVIPSLEDIAAFESSLPPLREAKTLEDQSRAESVKNMMQEAGKTARARIGVIQGLAQTANEISVMDFSFLHDPANYLLAIGYNVNDQKRDAACYDLLASEARLGYFIAIARGQLPQSSWFALGRQLVDAGHESALVSWSGSIFEYLMPLLVMPSYDRTLLHQTCRAIVRRHREYGAQRGVPWGISESGYHMFDAQFNYQYRAFGVPGLGLKRGLGDDLVVAPYASVMALMVNPEEACDNLQLLASEGFGGLFGLYEAIDYTPARLAHNKKHAVIRSFMAHHQGMGFLSLNHFLLDRPMQKRFAADPLFQATAPLLHEIMIKSPVLDWYSRKISDSSAEKTPSAGRIRVLGMPDAGGPEVQLLSNGRYHVMISNAGGGYSRWKDLALTRWREDAICDNRGSFCYIRDKASGVFWSTSWQPTEKAPQRYEAIFSEGRAEFRRHDGDIDTYTEIVVSPEDDIEIRRTRITNRAKRRKILDITSYTEIVIAPQAADAAHPAFSNLFVQTEALEGKNAILATRRPRSIHEQPPWMFHMMQVHGTSEGPFSFETSRLQFIGRRQTATAPQAMVDSGPLAGTQGYVLDPIAAIRREIMLKPGESVTIDIVTGIANMRDDCIKLIKKYGDPLLAGRAFEMSWMHEQAILRQLNITEEEAQLYERLASSVIYPNKALRADADILKRNRQGQAGLWRFGISGDLPIILLKIKDIAHIDMARQLIQAHTYWRLKGLAADVVIWNEDHGGYRQSLQDGIMGLIAGARMHMDHSGGIFVHAADQLSAEERILIETTARVIIKDDNVPLEMQIRRRVKEKRVPALKPSIPPPVSAPESGSIKLPPGLLFFNGTGGFSADGREYIILTGSDHPTPLPWSNVIANPDFGFVISESGQSYTWGENAHEFRLTPWHNDPVTDASGEAFYLRDEESGDVWSPAPLPTPGSAPYITRHGFGYSIFEYEHNGIKSGLRIYAAIDAPVKFSVLKVQNLSKQTRRLSATGYVEWVLGETRAKTGLHIVTEIDGGSGALTARNDYNREFSGRIAFFDLDDRARTVTGDRREFIGSNGSLQQPEALARLHLSGRTGAGFDACGALQTVFELKPGQEREIIFRLGIVARRDGEEDISGFIRRFQGSGRAQAAFDAVQSYWRKTLGTVQIATPDKAMDVLANGWLMYQTIACRLWARSGYYQSGGAFGFRDQLQDAMALVHTKPDMLRAQILLCARHQFIEGDVQHWWHPPSNRGVRTRCSDDYLWLPLAVCRYIAATQDTGILDEALPFLEIRPLNQDEDSYYDLPLLSSETATLYNHCIRALQRALKYGAHGLPLIGSCDWNDGMDKVGEQGKGESVWLGFFLYDILLRFADIAELKNDTGIANKCRADASQLRSSIEENGWDGDWYRRAYFDDGQPLGSSVNEECQIDSICQSWSVLSGAGDPEHTRKAMDSAYTRLVRPDIKLIQLLDPPFDKSSLNPGYIRGYVPGVRENGGQYTHAAIWMAMAFAKCGDARRAWEIFGMINPLNHARTSQEVEQYKTEPYVVAADVYGQPPHAGRGGWTWYTGSSGWMYRLILEELLGLHLEGDKLRFAPCLPSEWKDFRISYRYHETVYEIEAEISDKNDSMQISFDGVKQSGNKISLVNDGAAHEVIVHLPRNL